MRTLLILGAGRYGQVAKEIATAMNTYDKIEFLDDGSDIAVGKLADIQTFAYTEAIVAIGDAELRKKWTQKLERLATLVHPSAIVMPSARVGLGCIVEAGAVISSNARVGKSTIVMANAVVGHDAKVGDYCKIKYNCCIPEWKEVPSGTNMEVGNVYDATAERDSGKLKKDEEMERFEKKIWLASPTMHGEELKYVTEAYETNWMSTIGENINVIEKLAKEKVGCQHAVALSCGTSALHLAVKLAGIKAGDIVFCADMTFAATVNPILYEGAKPVFIDSEYETWNMDPVALEKAFELYPNAKAVMTVNLYGTPAKYDEICAIAEKHGAVVIEDAAESFGATYKGKKTGTFGTYNIISFNGNKIITGSSGGMLLTDDLEAANKARKWSTQSREIAPWYQHEEMGYNYRMSNVIAGVVRGQFPYLEEHIAIKKAIYERYKEGFKGLPVTMNPHIAEDMEPNYWLSCVLIDKSAMCKQERTATEASYVKEKGKTCPTEILETLASYNAEGRPIWKPMHAQPLYGAYPFVSARKDCADMDIFSRGLCLPSDIKMTVEEQNKIIQIVRDCFE